MLKINIRDILLIVLILLLVGILAMISMNKKNEQDVNMIVAIHIKGEVENPGYYEFSYESRVKDAIEKAGGATEKANLEGINLAAKLRDGEEIIIPAKAESVSTEKSEQTQTALYQNEKVNINTADMAELCRLDGIGEDIALSIIEYRTQNGTFRSVEDIKNVSGIGEAKFKNIKDSIFV